MKSATMMGRMHWREGGWVPHFIQKLSSAPAALAFLFAFQCVSGLHAGQPELFCATPSHDFGAVPDSSMVSNVFIVENRGDAPLRLGDMRVCCGGTMQVSAKDIPPGGRTEIAVSLSVRGRSGMQNKSMYIETDDPRHPWFRLRFTGSVIPENIARPVLPAPHADTTGAIVRAESSAPKEELDARPGTAPLFPPVEVDFFFETGCPECATVEREVLAPLHAAYSYASCCNSLTNIDYSDDTPDVAFLYDRLGRMTSAITAGVSTNLFEYDGLDLAAETQNGIAITRATDSLGRPADFTLGSDYEVMYGYDAYGRFHSVSSSVASATSMANYAYLPGSDLLSSMTNSSGFFWSRTYEQQRNLIASVENRFNANPISVFDYANDSLARRTRRVDNLTVTNDFGYNVRSEVSSAIIGTNNYSYAYDPIGNRLTATNNAEGWAYLSNPLNQYTNIADGLIIEPEYDADGNMTATGNGWRYVWNGENRMVLASNSQHIVTYAYDHQGRMVSKVVNGSARRYLWDGYNIVADARTACTNWFVWGLDLSGSLQGAGGVGGLLAEVKDGVPYFAASDANGNVTEYISTNGMTAAHYEYSPFGEIVVQSGELADSFTHRFSTKPWCEVTGLSEYLFRKYEPGMGRWMSRDPIGEEGGIDLYSAMKNCAIIEVDYLGLINKIAVLFGHGSDQDVQGNWLLNQAAEWFSKLDEEDALIPFGCKTQQVRELLVKKLQAGVVSGEQQLAIMTKLALLLTSGATWSIDMIDDNFLALWYSMMNGLYIKRDLMCEASANCPNMDVMVSFYCQEGDEVIDKVALVISHDYEKFIPEFNKIPDGETFCGKTWRWSCQGKYWEYWTW